MYSKHINIEPRMLIVFGLLILLMQGIFATKAEAVPAFARQVGQTCTACHAQHFPTLNSFGRMFKASGYTMVGAQEMIEGDGMSLPSTINAALYGTMQYTNTGAMMGTAKNMMSGNPATEPGTQSLGIPYSMSLYLGGRAGEKVGFLFEMPFERPELMDSTDAEIETGVAVARFGSFKTSYVDMLGGFNVGAHAFSTEMAGPAYGYELLSTGALGMNVAQTGANAMGAIGLHMEHGATLMSQFMAVSNLNAEAMGETMGEMSMAGGATGVGASLQNQSGFIYFSSYSGTQGVPSGALENPTMGKYLRAAWTPSIAGFDIGTGFQMYFGEVNSGAGVVSANATTFDFQAQGEMMGMPLGLFGTYATAPKSVMGKMNHYNMSTGGDNSSMGMLAEVSVMQKVSVSLGYVNATYNTPAMGMMSPSTLEGTSTTAGVEYRLMPNVRLALRYASFGGKSLDSSSTTATVYAGL